MRCAMILRMFVMGTRSPGYGAGVAAGRVAAGGSAGAGEGGASLRSVGGTNASVPARAGRDPWRSMKALVSCLVMRPPRPEPEICERLMPCSRAILRTSGEERASSSSSAGAELATGSAEGGGVWVAPSLRGRDAPATPALLVLASG